MMRRLAAILAALAMAWTTPALAWWDYGHRTVAAIAVRNVKPATRARIAALLRVQAQLGTPKCTVRSLEDAAVWPDCIKRDKWRWGYTSTWHYHDIPVCGSFDPKLDCADGNCVTAQIERTARILADKSLPSAQRLEALAFLSHFVGDIHQPLHGADHHDQGGNGVKLTYGSASRTNLHAIWDGYLAERAISSARPPLVRRYSAAERAGLEGGTPEDWLRESWQIARDFLYPQVFGGALPCDGNGDRAGTPAASWSEPSIQAGVPIVERRVEQAGLRLARMLDAALG